MTIEFNIGHTSTAPLIREMPFMFRYAASAALNDTAFDVRVRWREQMKRVFNNPRPYAFNSGKVMRKANKNSLEVLVGLEDSGGKGNAPDRFLAPQIYGGGRSQKRFEKALVRKFKSFGANTYFVPAIQNKEFLDRYGDLRGSVVAQMLQHLQAFGEQGYKGNIKNPKRALYFPVIHRGDYGMLHPGIYKRDAVGSENFKAVVYAVRTQPQYRKRFRYFEAVRKSIRIKFMPSFSRVFQRRAAKQVREFNMTSGQITRRGQITSRRIEAVARQQRVTAIRRSFGITRTGNTPRF